MAQSSIEWTEQTWNPTTGCTKISQGCKYCYAAVLAKRLKAMGAEKYRNEFELTLHPETLLIPYKWKKSSVIFVNSMSDLFHEDIPEYYIKDVFKVMNDCHWHTFQVLTKRSERLAELSSKLNWTPNIWMGVSVEDQKATARIPDLLKTNAAIKFISFEPLIGPVYLDNLYGIQWAIVGGESGFKARPIKEEWIQNIKNLCKRDGVAFFFKQWGGKNKKATGRMLDGRTYDEMPSLPKVAAVC